MDPDAALAAIRATRDEIQDILDHGQINHESIDVHTLFEQVDTLVEHYTALRQWLARGGFPPAGFPPHRITTPSAAASTSLSPWPEAEFYGALSDAARKLLAWVDELLDKVAP